MYANSLKYILYEIYLFGMKGQL